MRRGRPSKPNETRKNMGISTIHMSAFVSSRQQRGNPLSISVSLWRWGLSPPDRGRSGGTGAICIEVVLQRGIRYIARFCCMLCSPKMQERLARADPGWLVREVMGEAG
ncbi:hypothetical protein M9H77_23607 [Catharanthus roseus]|uniref:Uncharacterized protein n=1 Tax=Catharanthus roseus TaxID=4058 RepID=A0ACC0ATQ8_CATRO|nr:hypothetical protein M9H77_23607 [Catharanthus roseus]